mmetsp:Transcript_42486/g.98873  ORF Transcript_42486/g.98873 Transcript_42486/m.98873 type:complete len:362 (+) Transcript_42486:1219-2304(+)
MRCSCRRPSLFSILRNWTLWNPDAGWRKSRKSRKERGSIVSSTSICCTRTFMMRTQRAARPTQTLMSSCSKPWSTPLSKISCMESSSCSICLNHSSYVWWMIMKSISSCTSWSKMALWGYCACSTFSKCRYSLYDKVLFVMAARTASALSPARFSKARTSSSVTFCISGSSGSSFDLTLPPSSESKKLSSSDPLLCFISICCHSGLPLDASVTPGPAGPSGPAGPEGNSAVGDKRRWGGLLLPLERTACMRGEAAQSLPATRPAHSPLKFPEACAASWLSSPKVLGTTGLSGSQKEGGAWALIFRTRGGSSLISSPPTPAPPTAIPPLPDTAPAEPPASFVREGGYPATQGRKDFTRPSTP